MKKLIPFMVLISFSFSNSFANNIPSFLFNPIKEGATMQKMWVDYEYTQDGQYGMMIHADITIYDLQSQEVFFGIYFKQNDGRPDSYLKDVNGRFNTANGYVVAGKWLTPSYDNSVYTDVQVFMPYSELDLDAGEHDLTMQVDLVRKVGGTIAWLKLYDFTYTQYDATRGVNSKNAAKLKQVSAASPRAEFDKLWVEHNVEQNGVYGMMIHFKFVTYNMIGMDAYVAIYFMFNDVNRTLLLDKNGKFASSDGAVATYYLINPEYSPGYYDDVRVFMPNTELDITKPGKYDLIMDTKLIYKKGGLISNFGLYNLTYTL